MRVWLSLLIFTCGCSATTNRGAPNAGTATTPPLRSHDAAGVARTPHENATPPATTSTGTPPLTVRSHHRDLTSIATDAFAPVVRWYLAGAVACALVVLAFTFIVCRSRLHARGGAPPRTPRPAVTITACLPATAHPASRPEWRYAGPGDADLNCAYCRSVLRGPTIYCAACATPYHADCARHLTACAIYACGSLAFRAGAQPTFVAAATRA